MSASSTATANAFVVEFDTDQLTGHADVVVRSEMITDPFTGAAAPRTTEQIIVEVHLSPPARNEEGTGIRRDVVDPAREVHNVYGFIHMNPVRLTRAGETGTIGGTVFFTVAIDPSTEQVTLVEPQASRLIDLATGKTVSSRVRRVAISQAAAKVETAMTPHVLASARLARAEADAAWAQTNLERAAAVAADRQAALAQARAALESLV